jgi:hypothetical protein
MKFKHINKCLHDKNFKFYFANIDFISIFGYVLFMFCMIASLSHIIVVKFD